MFVQSNKRNNSIYYSGVVKNVRSNGNYDILYDDDGSKDTDIISNVVKSHNESLYLELYYKRQNKYDYRKYVDINGLLTILEKAQILEFIKNKFNLSKLEEAIEIYKSLVDITECDSNPIIIRIGLIGKFIDVNNYEYSITVDGVNNLKQMNMIKILINNLLNPELLLDNSDEIDLYSDYNILDEIIKMDIGNQHEKILVDTFSDSDNESEDELIIEEDDDENIYGKVLTKFEKKVDIQKLDVFNKYINRDYTESGLFKEFTRKKSKRVENYLHNILIETDYQLFNYIPLEGNLTYPKRTATRPIPMSDSTKYEIDNIDKLIVRNAINILSKDSSIGKQQDIINFLEKNSYSYGSWGFENAKKNEYCIDFDNTQKYNDITQNVPIALKCKSSVKKDTWYISPSIYCFSCKKPINIWTYILPTFSYGDTQYDQSEYNPGIMEVNCPYYSPSFSDWKKCLHCGRGIEKHNLYCPYDPTHKCFYSDVNKIKNEDMKKKFHNNKLDNIKVSKFLNTNNREEFNKKKLKYFNSCIVIKTDNQST